MTIGHIARGGGQKIHRALNLARDLPARQGRDPCRREFNLHWYAVAVFGSVILSGIAVLLYALLSGTPPVVPLVSAQALITAPLLFLIGGLVNAEEIGWRGFALPGLWPSAAR